MGMADVRSPKRDNLVLSFNLVPTDDKQITCIMCNRENCDYEMSYFIMGRKRITVGIHVDVNSNGMYINGGGCYDEAMILFKAE